MYSYDVVDFAYRPQGSMEKLWNFAPPKRADVGAERERNSVTGQRSNQASLHDFCLPLTSLTDAKCIESCLPDRAESNS